MPGRFSLYPRKGTLAVGSDADVVVFDPNSTTTISTEGSPSKVDYSIYENWTLAGSVRHVFSRGLHVVANGELNAVVGHGRFVERTASLTTQ